MKLLELFKARSGVEQAAIIAFLATTTYFSYGTILYFLGAALAIDAVATHLL